MKPIEKIRRDLKKTGIPIRAKKNGKWQAVDYINLLPEQVQEKARWDSKNWMKIANQILGSLGACFVDVNNVINDRSIIIAILALLRELNIEGKEI